MKKHGRALAVYAVLAVVSAVLMYTAWRDIPAKDEPAVVLSEPDEIPTDVTKKTGKISLNTATAGELMSVRGIGEKTAINIILYREEHGGFRMLEELLNVPGIGEKNFEAWAPYFTL